MKDQHRNDNNAPPEQGGALHTGQPRPAEGLASFVPPQNAEGAPAAPQKSPAASLQGGTAPAGCTAGAGKSAGEGAPQGGTAPALSYAGAGEAWRAVLFGACLGLAVIVPGVSGAAVALLFGLYEKLLYALGNIFRRFKACALFLLPIAAGAAVGFAVGFFAVRRLLELCPFAVSALFAGLMAGAYPAEVRPLAGEKRTAPRILLFIIGLALPLALGCAGIFGGAQADIASRAWYVWPLFLLLGFAVALTQVVPGLSATALLLALGCFQPLLSSVSLTYWRQDPSVFGVYACLGVGFIAGLIACSRGISRLFERRRAPAFFCIAGLALSQITCMFCNPELFAVYQSWAQGAPFAADLWSGVLLFIAAAVCSRLLSKKSARP